MKKLINAVLFVTITVLAFHHLQQLLSLSNVNLLNETDSYHLIIKCVEFVMYLSLALFLIYENKQLPRAIGFMVIPLLVFEIAIYFFIRGGSYVSILMNPGFTIVFLIKNVLMAIYFVLKTIEQVSLRFLGATLYLIMPVIATLTYYFVFTDQILFIIQLFKVIFAFLFILFIIYQMRYEQLHSRRINF